MNPRQFEEFACDYFRQKGYKVDITTYSNDYGVDAFAIKQKEKIAIQAKMYGHTTRKINRQMVMELHGAKDYFDCTKAVIFTDGQLLSDATEVANKLNIEVIYSNNLQIQTPLTKSSEDKEEKTFEAIWEKYIMPLEGKTLSKGKEKSNQITKVDWSGVERITSNGNKGKIKIEIFRQTVNKLLEAGKITRDEINQNYSGRASSGVVLILSQVPFFEKTNAPTGLKYVEPTMQASL